MQGTLLHPGIKIGLLQLAVADLARQIGFYEQLLGFQLLQRDQRTAVLGAGTTPLLRLEQQAQARARPGRTTGLYHFAVLLPGRGTLGQSLVRLAQQRYPLAGAADHLVSEAVYLADPEGNGIELYCDRPPEDWQWQAGHVQMANAPLDFDGILAAAEQSASDSAGLPSTTRIGHMHLQVADLQQAEAFYCQLLGFEVMSRWPGALFVSAGRYHHHLGLNVWETQGAPPPPADAVGLRYFSVEVPEQDEFERLAAALQAAGISVTPAPGRLALRDPWGIGVLLTLPDADPSWPA